MNFPRSVEPEWLDELPAENPRAVRSRQDLQRVNRWMLQARTMARLLAAASADRPPRTILELGAGDGTFMLSVASRMAQRWPGVSLTLLDRQNIVADGTLRRFGALGWNAKTVTADVFTLCEAPHEHSADIVTANLFLHHFQCDQLTRLFQGVARMGPVFAACEPWRSRAAETASRLLWAIGCNDVSRHDALISVRAGFYGKELSELWPKGNWTLHEETAIPFTHCFAACRTERVAQ